MIVINQVAGVREILFNLKGQVDKKSKGIGQALKKAGLYIQRESQKRVPVEFGFLKASAFTRSFGAGMQTQVITGYTARYALWVHEKVEMKLKGLPRRPSPPHKGRYWDPQGRAEAKFLENVVKQKEKDILDLIREELVRP